MHKNLQVDVDVNCAKHVNTGTNKEPDASSERCHQRVDSKTFIQGEMPH